VVVPRAAELQATEDELGHALVALVGGTRPPVSPSMVRQFLRDRFGIADGDARVRRHDPEDFVVWFRRLEDRERVLGTPAVGAQFTLIWRPWRRTSMTSAGSFRFRVLVGLTRVPLHARSAATAQTILGPSCANIEVVWPHNVPEDDGREFFVAAWCSHPRHIPDESVIFIPEPGVAIPEGTVQEELPGLRYLVRVRLVAFQDWSLPPDSPDGGNHGGGDGGHGDNGGGPDVLPDPDADQGASPGDDFYAGKRSSSDSGDSNFNRYHPGIDRRRDHGSGVATAAGSGVAGTLVVGTVACPVQDPPRRNGGAS